MSMPSVVRHINEARLVETLFRSGPMSRADLARALRLTRATAGGLVSGLIAKGAVVEGEKGDARKPVRTGRPGDDVRLSPNFAVFLGIEIGVNQLTAVAIDFNANLLHRHTQAMDPRPEPKTVIRQLAMLVDKVTSKLTAEQIVRGLAVTIPGLLNHEGNILRAPILGWSDVEFMTMLKSRFPELPAIQVENDANAAAFAEIYRAKESDPGDAVYLFLDVGIGGGVFSKGRLVTGYNGYAGELGHILVGEEGYGPVLTLAGSLESYVGRDAILSRYKHHLGRPMDWEVLIKATRSEEKAALATLHDCVYYLARGLATLTTILNPEKFVFGGQVSPFFGLNPSLIKTRVRENLLPNHPIPSLFFSPLGSDGPAIGAACILHDSFLAMDQSIVLETPKRS